MGVVLSLSGQIYSPQHKVSQNQCGRLKLFYALLNVDERGLLGGGEGAFWNLVVYYKGEEVYGWISSSFKAVKNELTLLLSINAASDFKSKPMLIYNAKNHKAPNNYFKIIFH
jgi:hypothetical protein